MSNKSCIHFYAAFCPLLLFVVLPSAVLTLKTTNCQSILFVRSVVRTARPSIIAPNEGGVERVFSELVSGARSAKNGLAGVSRNFTPHMFSRYYMRSDTKNTLEVIFWL